MKTILLLGGSLQQMPAIEYAKMAGYNTILCDYLSDNPGQYLADNFYQESTVDKEKILEIGRNNKIDGIVAYGSEPAAPTAAYVAEQLGLCGNSYESVVIMSQKQLFREFLKRHGFSVPGFIAFEEISQEVEQAVEAFSFPVIVKPVDSSGSKGVTCIGSVKELSKAVAFAGQYSKSQIFQAEEYMVRDHDFMVGGDIFVVKGQVKFWGFLNCHRDQSANELVPAGKSFPLKLSRERQQSVRNELQNLVTLLDLQSGAFNVEALVTKEEKVIIIELAPRNGGNMIPELLSAISGKDMAGATVECAMGNDEIDMEFHSSENCFASYNLHTYCSGIYEGVIFSPQIEPYIIKKVFYKKPGDLAEYFNNAGDALGIIFMKFPCEAVMYEIMDQINHLIVVRLKGQVKRFEGNRRVF